MGVFGEINNAVGAQKQLEASKKAGKQARADRERALGIAANQDWEPYYASQEAPTFQRSQSPVADAFLSSLLTGNNPAAVQGTRANAKGQKFAAQDSFDKMYGTPQELVQKQQAMQSETPWKVNSPEKPIVDDVERKNLLYYGAGKNLIESQGLSQEDMDVLMGNGLTLDQKTGKLVGKGKSATRDGRLINQGIDNGDNTIIKKYLEMIRNGQA